MLYPCSAGAWPSPSHEGGLTVYVRRQGGHGFDLDSILLLEDIKERVFLHSEDGAVSRRTCFSSLFLFFKYPVGGKTGGVHGGSLWPLVLCPVFGLMFLS